MAPLLVFLALSATAAAPEGGVHRGDPVVRVRATTAVSPCVLAAARAYEKKGRVVVETGSLADAAGADVLVGAAAEVTRALEGGAAAAAGLKAAFAVPRAGIREEREPHGFRGSSALRGRRRA